MALYNAKGVEQNYKEASNWFKKSAEQGNAKAQYNLGLMYDKGEGVKQDYKEAVDWYKKAALQGHSDARTVLVKTLSNSSKNIKTSKKQKDNKNG
ncbi:hypothetical protein AGMMS49921_01440 [Endomicrobiia bacterium]|nr:hypothetical protein AGMMS49921_01440 [Endomicrobiia bacterium]